MEKKLIESEKKYHTLARVSPVGIFHTDAKGYFVYVNQRWCEIAGLSPQEARGEGWRRGLHPADRQPISTQWHQAAKGNIPFKAEYRFQQRDGTTTWVLGQAMAELGDSGKVIGYVGTITDITERRKAEEEKKRLEAQLIQTQKMEAIGTLAGGIAHDFNNILFPIMGYTEMTMAAVSKESKAYHNLAQILKAAHRAREMVQQILTFSHPSEQWKKPIHIQSIIKEVLKLLRASLPATIEFVKGINNDCGAVMADPVQMHQVIMNLCTNAYHAMRDGGVLKVNLSEVDMSSDDEKSGFKLNPGHYLRLTVSDTGHGMDPSIVPKIFEPFFTTKQNGEGTGMGLSVVHGIIQSCGGDIAVYSEPGKGTTFHVYLPLIETRQSTTDYVPDESLPKGNERMLLIDDDAQIVQVLRQMLESLGYHVTSRTSGVEALETFRTQMDNFDFVITDMIMPKMKGNELVKELLDVRPDIPIIVCTGYSELMTKEKAGQIGIRDLIMKPLALLDLAKTIRKVLDEKVPSYNNVSGVPI
jgi:PAS domain S-box-containing protein